ncbi:MAG TPA: DnaJ domain-containing protein [Thermomicrobiales bacterium]|nr:DnaJ domain-containing protein [Thermomicrobiales bacterium]
MVLPLLYGLGAKDFLEPKGFLLLTCQKCKSSGPFAVFDSKRKVTLYSIPTISVREQMVLECRSCTQRFAVPPEMRQTFLDQVLTEPELLARLRTTSIASIGNNGERTFYQTLQVDPAADPDVIEAAFRRLAMKYHPDTSSDPEASTRMREIIEARECLSDPDRRLRYDRSIGIVRRTPGLRAEDI